MEPDDHLFLPPSNEADPNIGKRFPLSKPISAQTAASLLVVAPFRA